MSKKINRMGQEYSRNENKMYRATRLSPVVKRAGTRNIKKSKKS